MSKLAIFLSIVVAVAVGGYMFFPSTNAVKDSSGNKSELKIDRDRPSPDHGTFEKRFQPTAP